jgi:N-dimethylarginine dimethylaminohydrolase
MSAVRSFNDFDKLQEIVVGSAEGFNFPAIDTSIAHFFGPPPGSESEAVSADTLARVVAETEEDLQVLVDTLNEWGVRVRRPDRADHSRPISVLDWASTANHALMPRDSLLIVGEKVIEAPMAVRARYTETFPYRRLLREYFDGGADWLAAPRPQLPDETYQYDKAGTPVLGELEPLFDAANIIRCGRDLFYNVSNTGNRLGAAWLARILGPDYRVHEMAICADHVGTTLQLLKPGVLLANAGRLDRDSIPAPLRGWKTLWFDDPQDDGFGFEWPRASTWIGMNILSVDEETIIVPRAQDGLAKLLESAGFIVIPVPYRHGRTFGGGFHCCTLDVRRAGDLTSYL